MCAPNPSLLLQKYPIHLRLHTTKISSKFLVNSKCWDFSEDYSEFLHLLFKECFPAYLLKLQSKLRVETIEIIHLQQDLFPAYNKLHIHIIPAWPNTHRLCASKASGAKATSCAKASALGLRCPEEGRSSGGGGAKHRLQIKYSLIQTEINCLDMLCTA